jgi:hypothetical protein
VEVTPASTGKLLGVTVAGWNVPSTLPVATRQIGGAPDIAMWFSSFADPGPDIKGLKAVAAAGATPMITWEPWRGDSMKQTEFSLQKIASGQLDTKLTTWAIALKKWGGPVYLRFAQEPNGQWFPWCVGVNGNTAADYTKAFRRLHDVFVSNGATNVKFVWSPNAINTATTTTADLAAMYPGSKYVDLVGLDAYNWGSSHSWSAWQTPQQAMGTSIAVLRTVAPGKSMMITETSSVEAGGSKASWITQLFAYVASQPDVIGFVWFDLDSSQDWRMASSQSALTAMRSAAKHF